MAVSSGGIIAAHKLFGEKGRVAPQFCIAGHYGNHCHLFNLYGCDFPWIYYSGWNQCSKYFDNGNPWNSGHCDAVRAKYL